MAGAAAIGPVHTALTAAIQAALTSVQFSSGGGGQQVSLTVYDGVADQRPSVPYVVVGGSSSEEPFHTLGPATGAKFGGQVRIPVRVVTQYPTTEAQTYSMWSSIKSAIEQQPLTVAGFTRASVTVDGARLLTDTVGGIVTRELVAPVDVLVHQG